MATARLSADDVRDAYSLILGRLPESDAIIEAHRKTFETREALWTAILSSEEFRAIAGGALTSAAQSDFRAEMMLAVHESLYTDGSRIDHDVSSETLSILLERIRTQWTHLGETEPHWSVLVQDEFRSELMDDAAREAFNQSGTAMTDLIDLFERRTGAPVTRGVCLELGCGVGRITRHLARRFDQVIAVDISPGNLKICEDYLAAEGVKNVDLRLVSNPLDFSAFPEIDFFFSVIVLQHNSPPVQKFILESILRRIRPGGAALFQIPTAMVDYRFDVAEYLDTPHPTMEMHGLPTAVVLKTLRETGMVVCDVAADPYIGIMGSSIFHAVRPA
jgi:SAM-dependent methyltransferase